MVHQCPSMCGCSATSVTAWSAVQCVCVCVCVCVCAQCATLWQCGAARSHFPHFHGYRKHHQTVTAYTSAAQQHTTSLKTYSQLHTHPHTHTHTHTPTHTSTTPHHS